MEFVLISLFTTIGFASILLTSNEIYQNHQTKKINESNNDVISNDKIFTKKINELIKNDKNIIGLKEYKKLHKKHLKLISLLNNKTKEILKENILILLEKSIENLIIINKIKNILDVLDRKKLNKSNKKKYKKNKELLIEFKNQFEESLNTYDYIILKLIDIENRNDFDYEEIKTHINNIINLNLNINKYGYDLDGYIKKYPKNFDEFDIDQYPESLHKFSSNNLTKIVRSLH